MSRSPWPQSARIASFMCETWTGIFATRPIVISSSSACQKSRSSLRMWLMYRPPKPRAGCRAARRTSTAETETGRLTDDDRRDALRQHTERVAMIEQSAIVMAVGVDEARRERQRVRVYHMIGGIARPMADGIDAAA